MAEARDIDGIENAPVYLVSVEPPWTVRTDEFIAGTPLRDLIEQLKPGEHLYLVDYSSQPGRTRLTCLI